MPARMEQRLRALCDALYVGHGSCPHFSLLCAHFEDSIEHRLQRGAAPSLQHVRLPHVCCAAILHPRQPSHDPPLWEKEAASSGIHASLLPALSGTSNAQPRGLQHQNQRDSRPGSEDAPPPKALSYGG